MLIRDVADADLDALWAINEANVPNVGSVDRIRFAALAREAVIALAVVVDDRLVGFTFVFAPGAEYDSENYLWFMEHVPGAYYLDRVAFDAEVQGRGLGRALYDEVADRLARDHSDASALTLEVNVDPPNEQSLRFHRRQGFVEVGRRTSKGIEVSLMSRP
ncbi:MAG: GNAT family N-acetyltransferase [Actinomycetota bacterium]